MLPLITAIFVASLIGSTHCAGMCGAFVAVAAGAGQPSTPRRQALLQGCYHVGRLITYVLLGAAAGTAGRMVNLAGTLAGLRSVAAVLAGVTMLSFGVVALLRAQGVQFQQWRLPYGLSRLIQSGHRAAMNRPPLARALVIGLLTTLLPCSWLYYFAITAAGTASPWLGGLTMAVFWAGTLPALVIVGAGVRGLLGPLGRRAPLITALLLIAAGMYTLVARAQLDPARMLAPSPSPAKHSCCTP